jgi:hypothetical protein
MNRLTVHPVVPFPSCPKWEMRFCFIFLKTGIGAERLNVRK